MNVLLSLHRISLCFAMYSVKVLLNWQLSSVCFVHVAFLNFKRNHDMIGHLGKAYNKPCVGSGNLSVADHDDYDVVNGRLVLPLT